MLNNIIHQQSTSDISTINMDIFGTTARNEAFNNKAFESDVSYPQLLENPIRFRIIDGKLFRIEFGSPPI